MREALFLQYSALCTAVIKQKKVDVLINYISQPLQLTEFTEYKSQAPILANDIRGRGCFLRTRTLTAVLTIRTI